MGQDPGGFAELGFTTRLPVFIYRIIKTYSNLGSRGVRAPKSLMILMSIQLLVDDVISLKKVGARER
jgi:hypothetical protein